MRAHNGPVSRTLPSRTRKVGVAKTTTVARRRRVRRASLRVLLVDLDSQACLTYSLGVDPEAVDASTHDLLLGKADASDAVVELDEGMDLVPAGSTLGGGVGAARRRRAGAGAAPGAAADPSSYDVLLLVTARRRGGGDPERDAPPMS